MSAPATEVTMEALEDLRLKVVAAATAVETMNDDLQSLKRLLEGKTAEIAGLTAMARRLHHDHQGTRQIVINLLDELERLIPRGGKP